MNKSLAGGSPATGFTYAVVKFLRWLALAGAAVMLLALCTLIIAGFFIPPADLYKSLPVMVGMLGSAGIAMFLFSMIMRKLEAILSTVRAAHPFVRENGVRLRSIGWLLIIMHIAALAVTLFGAWYEHGAFQLDIDFELSLTSLLAILLCFVLAHVFDQGSDLADDVEGTI